MFKNNIKALILEGEYTDEQVATAFNFICLEFIDAAGIEIEQVEGREEIAKLQHRVLWMQTTIQQQEIAINLLSEPFQDALKDFEKYRYKLEWTGDKDKFITELNRIKDNEKTFCIMYEDAKAEYNEKERLKRLASPNTPKEQNDEVKFVSMLNDLGRFQGYRLNQKETSMLEVARMYKSLCELNERSSNN